MNTSETRRSRCRGEEAGEEREKQGGRGGVRRRQRWQRVGGVGSRVLGLTSPPGQVPCHCGGERGTRWIRSATVVENTKTSGDGVKTDVHI